MKKKNKLLTKVVGAVAITTALAFPAFGLSACGNDKTNDTNNPGEHQPANPENKISVTLHYPTGLNRADEVIKVDKGDTFAKIYNHIAIPGCRLVGLYAGGDFANKLSQETEITDSNCSVYAKLYLDLTVTSNDTNMGTVATTGSLTELVPGTNCTVSGNVLTLSNTTITATPKTGYELVGWQLNHQTLVSGAMTQGGAITAVFSKETFNVAVVENGNPTNEIYTGNVEYGTTVGDFKTTIAKQTGYNITQVMIDGNPVADSYVIVKGNVLAVNYTINVNLTASHGTLSQTSMALTPSATLAANANVLTVNGTAVTATADTGYHFVEWQVNGTTFDATTNTNVTITKNTTIVAVFAINQYTVTMKDNLGNDIKVVPNVEHGTTFATIKPDGYQIVAAKLADNTVINDQTPITAETMIYITYAKDVSVGVVDNENQASANGTVSTSEITINTGDTFTIADNTLTVGNTTLTVNCATGYNIIKWLLGTTRIENGTIYDGTENTISVAIDNIKYEVAIDLTGIEETEQTKINTYLGENFSITESVPAGTTVKQLSDRLSKYGITLYTVAFTAEYQEEDVINVEHDATTAITEDTTIYVISCLFYSPFKYGDNLSSIAGLDDNYTSLEEVYIPMINNEKTIILSTFINYSNLKTIIFGGSAIIRSGAFSGCNIENIYVPSLEVWLNMELSSELFPNGVNLYINNELVTDLEITSGMTIGDYAFAGIKNIQNVTVCSDVTTVGASAFKNCTGLKTITFESSSNINIANDAFCGCSELTTLTGTLGTVGDRAFEYCTKLTGAFTINGNIGDYAFKSCSNLTSVILNDSITTIGEMAFNACINLKTINIPTSLTTLGACAFMACKNITSIVLPNSLTVLNKSTFTNCTGLLNVTLSSNLESIGGACFEGCSSLTSITIPQSVTWIDANAFKNSALGSVQFENIDGWNAEFSADDLENNATLLKKTNKTYRKS